MASFASALAAPVCVHLRARDQAVLLLLPYVEMSPHEAATSLLFDRRTEWAAETLGRWCECSSDVHMCSLHSAHTNFTINMQLRFYSGGAGGGGSIPTVNGGVPRRFQEERVLPRV
jgi:hypothetical protein